MFNFVLTVPRLLVEQVDKQTPEVGSSDLVAIGRGNRANVAEVPVYYSVRLVPSPSRSHVFYSMSLHMDNRVLLADKARRTGNILCHMSN